MHGRVRVFRAAIAGEQEGARAGAREIAMPGCLLVIAQLLGGFGGKAVDVGTQHPGGHQFCDKVEGGGVVLVFHQGFELHVGGGGGIEARRHFDDIL
jgi:hypothetical protein